MNQGYMKDKITLQLELSIDEIRQLHRAIDIANDFLETYEYYSSDSVDPYGLMYELDDLLKKALEKDWKDQVDLVFNTDKPIVDKLVESTKKLVEALEDDGK